MKIKEVIKLLEYNKFDLIEVINKEINWDIFCTNSFYKNYWYKKGDIPICLVAHIDTVWERIKVKREGNILKSALLFTGIGADDRLGVAFILTLIRAGYKPHILLLDSEELGGLGANEFIKQVDKIDVNLFIELDRCGSNDYIMYDNTNEKTKKYIENFGFVENYGSFTDISILCPYFGISGINLSIGYYKQHTSDEYIDLQIAQQNILRIVKILKNPPKKKLIYESFGDY